MVRLLDDPMVRWCLREGLMRYTPGVGLDLTAVGHWALYDRDMPEEGEDDAQAP